MMIPHEFRRDPSARYAPFAGLYVFGRFRDRPVLG